MSNERCAFPGITHRQYPQGSEDISVDSRSEARQKLQLNKYYQKIIETIKDADKILVMGPGKTKQELKNHIEKRKTTASKISDLQPGDKTTDNQISSRVRTFFKTS